MEQKTITVIQVEYPKLEKHIRKVYGLEDPKGKFSVVAMEEWSNDSNYLLHLNKEPLDKWDQKAFDKWKADPLGLHGFRLRVILQDMVNNGHLEEGDYLITVSW